MSKRRFIVAKMRREAVVRSVLDFGLTMNQAARAAGDGTLPVGRALGPFKIRVSTVHAIVHRERVRRRPEPLEMPTESPYATIEHPSQFLRFQDPQPWWNRWPWEAPQ